VAAPAPPPRTAAAAAASEVPGGGGDPEPGTGTGTDKSSDSPRLGNVIILLSVDHPVTHRALQDLIMLKTLYSNEGGVEGAGPSPAAVVEDVLPLLMCREAHLPIAMPTCPSPNTGSCRVNIMHIDRKHMRGGSVAYESFRKGRAIMSCGTPSMGTAVVHPVGKQVLPCGGIGEIWITGEALQEVRQYHFKSGLPSSSSMDPRFNLEVDCPWLPEKMFLSSGPRFQLQKKLYGKTYNPVEDFLESCARNDVPMCRHLVENEGVRPDEELGHSMHAEFYAQDTGLSVAYQKQSMNVVRYLLGHLDRESLGVTPRRNVKEVMSRYSLINVEEDALSSAKWFNTGYVGYVHLKQLYVVSRSSRVECNPVTKNMIFENMLEESAEICVRKWGLRDAMCMIRRLGSGRGTATWERWRGCW